MSRNDDTSSNKAVWIGTLCALVIAAAVGVAVWMNKKTESSPEAGLRKPETTSAQQGPAKVTQPIPKSPAANVATPEQTSPPPVVDYDKLKKDKSLRALMEKRKEKYGFENGVDLIVKPDESVKVGDAVVPMNEILDRIRLKEGEVVEKDIGGTPAVGAGGDKRKNMTAELDTVEKRYEKLDRLIKETNPTQDKEKTETYTKERKELGKIVTVYEDYKETVKKIEEKKKLLASLNGKRPAPASSESADNPAPAAIASPRPAEKTAVPTPEASAKTVSTAPEPIREEAVPIKSNPAVGAGTNQRALSPLPGQKTATGDEQRSAAPMPPETRKPAASADTSTIETPIDTSKTDIAANRINPVSPAPQGASPTPAIPPEASVREGKRMVNIESLRKEIQEEINTLLLQKGDLENELLMLMKKEKRPEAYGIYVVRRRDNIWNIHYKFLQEYFGHRHIDLSRNADEPDTRGRSSGVGKVLKFSEKMVYIYNIREHRLASDINLIHPLSKIVVFNMAKVFDLLEGIDYRDMDQIQFDGENIWLPAKS